MTPRVLICIAVVLGLAVVVLSEPARANDLGAALMVALGGRDYAIATSRPPVGALRLERAAGAQHTALQRGADVAVWIDQNAIRNGTSNPTLTPLQLHEPFAQRRPSFSTIETLP